MSKVLSDEEVTQLVGNRSDRGDTERLVRDTEAAVLATFGEPLCWIPKDAADKLLSNEPKLILSGVPCYKYDGEGTTPLYALKKEDTE